MVKNAAIEIFSILEPLDKPSEEIEDEILKEFLEGFVIPWAPKSKKSGLATHSKSPNTKPQRKSSDSTFWSYPYVSARL